METREVKTYAWNGFVSGHLIRRERAWVARIMQATLEAKTRDTGYEPLPDTFGYQLVWPGDDDALILSPEDQEFLRTRDVVWARTWLRCYSIEEAA